MYLGIDLGTSSVKIVLIDSKQKLMGEASCKLSISHPKALWSEQDPKEWWKATNVAMQNLKDVHSKELSQVKAIGLSGQQHGAVLLNKENQVLRPAILWNDGRSFEQCTALEKAVPNFNKITGNQIMPGFTAPKLLWVEKHEPEIFKKMHKTLLPKDYLRLMMTGEYATDMSDASGTMWLDVKNRTWSKEMLEATHLSEKHMPKLFEGPDVTAQVLSELALRWGIPSSAVVVAGAGDNAASALSLGVIKSGSSFLSIGSSGVYFVASDAFNPSPKGGVHTMCHCLPNLWHQMTVHLSAASSLEWWKKASQEPSVKHLIEECKKNPNLSKSLYFLPYLSGERSPHNDPYAKGVFFGLTHASQRFDMTRAVLEGVAFNFAQGQSAMLKAGSKILETSVVGGGSTSFYWGTILASALGRPLTYRKNREVGAAFGAAKLAYLGISKQDPLTLAPCGSIEHTAEPNPEMTILYKEKQKIFSLIYEQLKPVFAKAYKG